MRLKFGVEHPWSAFVGLGNINGDYRLQRKYTIALFQVFHLLVHLLFCRYFHRSAYQA